MMSNPLLELRNLTVAFDTEGGEIRPVQEVSLSIYPGQTVALVGESGCGKSVTALSILRLIPSPPGKVLGGQILFEGKDLLPRSEKQMQAVRGKDIAMIFQEPMTSLNPVFTVGEQIVEAVQLHQKVGTKQAQKIAEQSMHDVGIADPHKRLHEYPHRLSGGMRQRIMIAMALSCRPKLLIADETMAGLSNSEVDEIISLLFKLNEQGIAIIMIEHIMRAVMTFSQRAIVLVAGKKIADDSPDVVMNDAEVVRAYLGE